MDRPEPLLTPEERESLKPQRPPERFAEQVMGHVLASSRGRRRRTRVLVAVSVVALAVAAGFALVVSRGPETGDVRADARRDVRVGPHVVAVLEPGAHIAWRGDEVTQDAGEVFYRVEAGGTRRVHTPAGDVTVRGTCFDVKVRPAGDGGVEMKRRDIVSGAVGAVAGAAVLVGVYEGRVTFSNAHASMELGSGQGATGDGSGLHGPEDLGAAGRAFEAGADDEAWRMANASLADQVRAYQRRLDDNESQKKTLERELRQLKAKVAAAARDGGGPRNVLDVDPRDLTQEDWKELAKQGRVRTKFFCPPPGDWHPSAQQLAALGLSPDDAPTLERAVQGTQDRMWQTIGPECTKMLGNADLAKRLGGEMCGLIIQMTTPKATADADVQLVADIRAGNKPMPPPGQLDPLTSRLLALTGESSAFENELTQDLGPEAAHRIAHDDDGLGIGCGLEFAPDP
jgi:hypothetical protein